MSTETETNPADDAYEAEADEVSSQTTDEAEGSDPPDDADETELDNEQSEGDADEGEDDPLEDVEFEGKTYRVAPEVKAAMLRTADYTRKTQEVAETRKALEARDAALAQQAEQAQEIQAERVHLALIERQIKALDGLDWDKLEEEEPEEANRLFRQRQRLRDQQVDLKETLSKKQSDFELARKRSAQEAHVTAVKECEAVLRKDIKGWDEKLARKVGAFAEEKLGWDPRVLGRLTDPVVIKTLHAAFVGSQAASRLSVKSKLEAGDKTDPVRPPGGGNAGTPRKTTDASGDKLSTAEWIKRENEREAQARKALRRA